jgi:hypothetical protein
VRLEASDSSPIAFADTGGGRVYFGGTVSQQGSHLVDLSNVTFCTDFSYGADGQLLVRGGKIYQQSITQAGNTNFSLSNGVGRQWVNYQGVIDNPDNSYSYLFQGQLCVDGAGTFVVTNSKLVIDTHSYGAPTASVSGSLARFANSNWPSGTNFTVHYDIFSA